jgi:predicted GIY-YIG superfamily endonuclease
MWFVYILECADASFYIGETGNIDVRVAKHADGSASRFTAARRPVKLVFSEMYDDRPAALGRERQLKGWTRAKKEALVAGDKSTLKGA